MLHSLYELGLDFLKIILAYACYWFGKDMVPSSPERNGPMIPTWKIVLLYLKATGIAGIFVLLASSRKGIPWEFAGLMIIPAYFGISQGYTDKWHPGVYRKYIKKKHGKAIVILVLLLQSATALNAQVHKFRAFQSVLDTSYGKNEIPDNAWDSVDILIVFDTDKKRLTTYGEKELVLDITKTYRVYKNPDNNEVLSMEAVDNEGAKHMVYMTEFKKALYPHVATLRIADTGGDLVFRLKNIN